MKRIIVRSLVLLVVFALIGQVVSFLIGRYFGHDADPNGDEFDIVNIFGGSSLVSRAGALRAGTARTYFGGTELDLRGAEIAPGGAYLEITTCFSGTEVLVSPEWRVDVLGMPQAGGHEVSVTEVDELAFDAPHLIIDARTFFGGLEVRAGAGDDDRSSGDADAPAAVISTGGASDPEAVESLT